MTNYVKKIYKEWQIMSGLYLVLVTLHGQFTISIWEKQLEFMTLNTICSVASKTYILQ